MEQQAKKSFIISFIFAALVGLIIYISGKFLFQYLFPFVIAAIIAWFVQKPAKYLSERTRFKRGTCAAVLSVFIYIGAALILFFAFSGIVSAFRGLMGEVPAILEFLEEFVLKLKNSFSVILSGISEELSHQVNDIALSMLANVKARISNGFSGMAASLASRLPSFLFSSIVTLVAGCFIAKDFEQLSRFIRELLGEKIFGNIIKIKYIVVTSVLRLLKGYLILMIITFSELTVGFFIMGISYAPLLALLISFVDLLPVFGTGTVLIPWSIAEFISGNTGRGVGIVLIYITVSVVRNFLEPKIIGKQMGINPLFTLIAMFAGLKIFGFLGLVLFPVTLIVVIKYYKNEMELEEK